MINAIDLVKTIMIPYEEKWGYIWGTAGIVWTSDRQKNATRDQTIKYGSKWIGKKVADCSGLFVWAFSQYNEKIYHGSDTIWRDYCSDKGTIKKGQLLYPGTAVFLYDGSTRHHIGCYVGNGEVVEARGTAYGLVKSGIDRWDEWGLLNNVYYDDSFPDIVEDYPNSTIRMGSVGSFVHEVQEMLIYCGYSCGDKKADGIFGKDTKSAIMDYQKDHLLTCDGVCGPKTLKSLTETYNDTKKLNQEENENNTHSSTNTDNISTEEKIELMWNWFVENHMEVK